MLVFQKISRKYTIDNPRLEFYFKYVHILKRKGGKWPIICFSNSILYYQKYNKKSDKRFNNHGYSWLFLMGIFLKHLRLIPNILKWQSCKIFIALVPLHNPSRRSHRRCSVKKDILKNVQNFSGKHLCWVCFKFYWKETPTKVFFSEIYKIFKNTCFEEYLLTTASDKT